MTIMPKQGYALTMLFVCTVNVYFVYSGAKPIYSTNHDQKINLMQALKHNLGRVNSCVRGARAACSPHVTCILYKLW